MGEITKIKNVELKALLTLLAQFNQANYEAIDITIGESLVIISPVRHLELPDDDDETEEYPKIKPQEGPDESFGGVTGL
jgi:hypothetical protein